MVTSLMLGLVLCGAPDDGLLDKLTAHAARLEALEKGDGELEVFVKSDELDDKGTVTRTKDMKLKVSVKAGREPSTTLVSLLDDGKDVTEAERKEIESKKRSRSGGPADRKSMSELSPFSKANRGSYAFELLAHQGEPTFVQVGFSPKAGSTTDLMKGSAVVDPTRGEVVAITMSPSKTPAFVTTLNFEAKFDQVTSAGRSLSMMRIKGQAGFAFIQKRFDVTSTFHRLSP